MTRPIVIALVTLLGCLVVHDKAHARWKPEHGQQPQEIQDWFRSLKNKRGQWCCADADGWRPNDEDIIWDMDTGKYRVNSHGAWLVVEDYAVLDVQNKVGRAVVWIHQEENSDDGPHVVCFLRGSEL